MKLAAEKTMEEAGYVWSINTNLGDGKMMQITGNFAKGATSREMSAEVDKCAKVLQIQRIKLLEIPTCEGALRTQAEAADRFTDDLDKLIEQNRDKEKVRTDVKNMMENLRENIGRTADNIEAGKRHLDTLLATLAGLEAED